MTRSLNPVQDSAVPGTIRRDVRPPIASDSAPQPGTAEGSRFRMRRTVRPRAIISPTVWPTDEAGHPVTSEYVRTFWTAAIGPGAVADLLRLATAASRGRSLRRPVNLSLLCIAGLARQHDGELQVRTAVPSLSRQQLRALPPAVRRLHDGRAA